MSFSHVFTREELLELGLRSVGQDVNIDRSVRIFGTERLSIGDHVRIDPFCIISAGPDGISIGRNVHIAGYCFVGGRGRIEIQDFAGLSSHVSVYSATDDYTGGAMTNPTVAEEFKNVRDAPVVLKRHAIIGASSVILPGVTVGLAAAIGALTMIRKDVADFAIMSGCPAKEVGKRSDSILEREAEFLRQESSN